MIGDPSAQEEKGHQGLQGVVRGKDGHSRGAGVKEQVRIRRLQGCGPRLELQVSDAGQSWVIWRRW